MKENIPYKLLTGYFLGKCSENERLMVEEWLKKTSENQRIFDDYKIILDRAGKTVDFNPDTESALKKVHIIMNDVTVNSLAKSKTTIGYYIIRIAALLIFGVFVWAGMHYLSPASDKLIVYQTKNNIEDIILTDGSIITLNSNSTIKYPKKFNKKERIIEFEGEGFFVIAKTSNWPFKILAQNTETRILGTKFNLRAILSEKEVIVTVTEGKVSLSNSFNAKEKKSIEIVTGEKGILNKDKKTLYKEKNLDFNLLSWKTGTLSFENTPIESAIKDISRYYNTKIILENKQLEDKRINLTFTNTTLNEAIEILKLTLDVEIEKQDTNFIIR